MPFWRGFENVRAHEQSPAQRVEQVEAVLAAETEAAAEQCQTN